MLSFENTEIAFRYKSKADLKRSYFLFSILANNWVVKAANAALKFALKLHIPVAWIIKPTIYRQFVGGVTLDDCKLVVGRLAKYKVKSVLDYSIEGGSSINEIEASLQETLRSVKNAGTNPDIPFAVFKPTAFCDISILEKMSRSIPLSPEETKEGENFQQRVESLCRAAYEADVPILIDAEDSWYQKAIDEVVDLMMLKFNREKAIVYNTFQMYRHDRFAYLELVIARARENHFFAGLKFVRGAYMEKERARAKKFAYPSPIHVDKTATDHAFNQALELAVANIDTVAIFCGTHNEESNLHLTRLIDKNGLKPGDPRIWFSQLYGMSDHISFNLATEGYHVAKYVPYGPVSSVMPYLFRRAEENTSIAGQTGRELRLLRMEKMRRRKDH